MCKLGKQTDVGDKAEEILKSITLICKICHMFQGSGSTIPTWLITRWGQASRKARKPSFETEVKSSIKFHIISAIWLHKNFNGAGGALVEKTEQKWRNKCLVCLVFYVRIGRHVQFVRYDWFQRKEIVGIFGIERKRAWVCSVLQDSVCSVRSVRKIRYIRFS